MFKLYYLKFGITSNGKFFYGIEREEYIESAQPLDFIWTQGFILTYGNPWKSMIASTRKSIIGDE